jgi:hypothetical protein
MERPLAKLVLRELIGLGRARRAMHSAVCRRAAPRRAAPPCLPIRTEPVRQGKKPNS